jgi:hypothetical protein
MAAAPCTTVKFDTCEPLGIIPATQICLVITNVATEAVQIAQQGPPGSTLACFEVPEKSVTKWALPRHSAWKATGVKTGTVYNQGAFGDPSAAWVVGLKTVAYDEVTCGKTLSVRLLVLLLIGWIGVGSLLYMLAKKASEKNMLDQCIEKLGEPELCQSNPELAGTVGSGESNRVLLIIIIVGAVILIVLLLISWGIFSKGQIKCSECKARKHKWINVMPTTNWKKFICKVGGYCDCRNAFLENECIRKGYELSGPSPSGPSSDFSWNQTYANLNTGPSPAGVTTNQYECACCSSKQERCINVTTNEDCIHP